MAFPQPDWGITERQNRLLALLACTDGKEMTEHELLNTIHYPSIVQRDRDIAFLQAERHLIERAPLSWRKSYSVRPEFFLRAAMTALLYFPDVVASAGYVHHRGDSWRLNIVRCLADGDLDDVPGILMWRSGNFRNPSFPGSSTGE